MKNGKCGYLPGKRYGLILPSHGRPIRNLQLLFVFFVPSW
jgi:hypothetical protein